MRIALLTDDSRGFFTDYRRSVAIDDWHGLASAIGGWIRGGFARARGAGEVMRARYHPKIIAQRHGEIYQDVLGRT